MDYVLYGDKNFGIDGKLKIEDKKLCKAIEKEIKKIEDIKAGTEIIVNGITYRIIRDNRKNKIVGYTLLSQL